MCPWGTEVEGLSVLNFYPPPLLPTSRGPSHVCGRGGGTRADCAQEQEDGGVDVWRVQLHVTALRSAETPLRGANIPLHLEW